MGLKVDKSHKKIDLKSLVKSKAKKLSIALSSLVMSLTLFSGCGKKIEENIKPDIDSTTSVSDTTDSTIPTDVDFIEVDDQVYVMDYDYSDSVELTNAFSIELDDGTVCRFDKLTYGNFNRVTSISILLEDGVDYRYLNYLTNLKKIYFIDNLKEDKLDYINGSIFKSGIDITFNPSSSNISTFNEDKFPFLKQISSIGNLGVGRDNAYSTSGSFINELNVDNLVLNIDENTNIKSIDFSKIKSLEIIGEPYNVAVYLSLKDIYDIEKKGISVTYKNIDKFVEVSSRIDEIYNGLGINDSLTDKQKLDKILGYVLKEYSYDEKIQQYLDEGVEHSSETQKFYEGGYLYGALDKDTEICGNYASMTAALCKRANIDSYVLTSTNHAWDAVKLGDYYYYVDPTWIDGQDDVIIPYPKDKVNFDNGMSIQTHDYVSKKSEDIFQYGSDYDKSYVDWYLENPFELPSSGNIYVSHDLRFVPDGLVLTDIPDKFRIEQLGIDVEKVNNGPSELAYSENTTTYKITVKKDNGESQSSIVGEAFIRGVLIGLGYIFIASKLNKKDNKNDKNDKNDKNKSL